MTDDAKAGASAPATNVSTGSEKIGWSVWDRASVITVVALAGMGVGLLLTRIHYHMFGVSGSSVACGLEGSSSCASVLASRWAEPIPGLSAAAVATSFFFGIAVLSLFYRGKAARLGAVAGFILCVLGLVVSGAYLTIMLGSVRSFCPLCATVDGLVLILTVLYGLELRRTRGARASGLGELYRPVSLVVAMMGVGVGVLSWRFNAGEFQKMMARYQGAPVEEIRWVQRDTGKINVVVFGDLGCAACQRGFITLQQVEQNFPGKLNIIWKQFPMDIGCNPNAHGLHPGACTASVVALAAKKQGKYLETAGDLYNHLEKGDLKEYAEELYRRLPTDASAEGIEQRTADIEQGTALKVEQVPTYFIEGKRVVGPPPFAFWAAVIKEREGAGR